MTSPKKNNQSCKRAVEVISRKIFGSLLLMIFLSFIASSIPAQVGSGSFSAVKKDTKDKADGSLKSIAHVNPSTLAMEMNVPLMSYSGRSGNKIPVGFNYSSKVWRMDSGQSWFYLQPGSGNKKYVSDIHAKFGERTAGGWTGNIIPPRIDEKAEVYDQEGQPFHPNIDETRLNSVWSSILQETSESNLISPFEDCRGVRCCDRYWCDPIGNNLYSCYCTHWVVNDPNTYDPISPRDPPPPGGTPPPTFLYYVKRIYVHMSDGSSHEMRQSEDPISCGNSQSGCATDLNGTFESVDGTGMRMERNNNGSILFLPDGSRYIFPAIGNGEGIYAEQYLDADGNRSAFVKTFDSANNQATSKWTDTVGRIITDPMQQNWTTQRQNPGINQINLPGANGVSQNYSIRWENLKPSGCETSVYQNCVSETGKRGGALEDQTQKLYYEARYFCHGNISDDLLTNPANLEDPSNEVLFPRQESGVRPCNGFNVRRNSSGQSISDANGNPTPYATRFNPVVLSEVTLPNGKSYIFKYNRYGEISKIIYPSGSSETFKYGQIAPLNGANSPAFDQTNRGVIERNVYRDAEGNQLEQRWQYSATSDLSNIQNPIYKITTIAPKQSDPNGSGTKSEKWLIADTSAGEGFGFNNPLAGMPKEERGYDENGILRSRTLTDWITAPPRAGGSSAGIRDPRVRRSVSITIENGQALATLSENDYETPGASGVPSDPQYFAHLNVKRAKSYEFAAIDLNTAQTGSIDQLAAYFGAAQLVNTAETDYQYDAAYQARGINSLPIENRVYDKNGSVISKTQTVFDEPERLVNDSPALAGSLVADWADLSGTWTNPGTNVRGKATTTKLWDSDRQTWIAAHAQYDQYGNLRKAWDASGDPTRFAETEYGSAYGCALPTKIITPAPSGDGTRGTTEGSLATKTYDLTTGLPLTATDEFGQTTATEYVDPLLRPTRVYAVNFTAPETQMIYGDQPSNLYSTVRKQIDATHWDEATTFADSLGRTIKTQSKDVQGDVFTRTEYDFTGKVKRATSPYRQGETVYWNAPRYDEMGRAVESYAPAVEGDQGASLGVTSYGISTAQGMVGTTVTSVDASGRKSRALSNSLGQLARVDEADSNGNLDPLPQGGPTPTPTPTPGGGGSCLVGPCNQNFTASGNAYPMNSTFYKYDIKGNMVEVVQGAQKRLFLYDSLGRLIRVRQPEQEVNPGLTTTQAIDGNNQWTAAFSYDALGNVVTAIDAKGVVITNAYDKANRVISKTYSNEPAGQTATPRVDYYYDGTGLDQALPAINFAKGKLSKVTNTVSETRYTKFDNLGRLKESEQRTPFNETETIQDAVPRVSKYEYNLAGALTDETYPSGRVVHNDFNTGGDLASISSKRVNGQFQNYAGNFSYTASGLIDKLQLGNGRYETAKFNERQQITELALGTSPTDTSLWKLNYEYGELDNSGNVDAAKNTGNVAKQTISFAGQSAPFVQTYKYDSLYRITEAKETSNNQQTWSQSYGYDRYGNRTAFAQNLGNQQTAINSQTLPAVDPLTNRFTDTNTYHYDKNGNITNDATSTAGARNFIFNGDNKQTEVKDSGGNVIGKYFYDGEGKRVKKLTVLDSTIFVYSAGKLVAEYSTNTPPEHPTTNYVHTDTLQSVRAVSDKQGNIISRRDFMPFGEEIYVNTAARTANDKYTSGQDAVRKRFTGYEKDTETDLDFAEARYYNNRHGRFTAVDPLLASGKSANPQTFNRYVYVGGNPLNTTDPLGLDWFQNGKGYKWSDDNKSFADGTDFKGWSAVDFGDSSMKYYDGCANADCSSTKIAVLYKEGGWNWSARNELDSSFSLERITSREYLGARNSQARDAAGDVIGGISGAGINTVAGSYNLGASAVNYFGGNLPRAWEYTPATRGQSLFYHGTNAAMLAEGGISLFKGISAGIKNWNTVKVAYASSGRQFTKSSLQLGQQMHKEYKTGEVVSNLAIKEFRLPSGRRIDFLDIPNRTIFELKPFNPRQIRAGQKQLEMYRQELQSMERFSGIDWTTVLDTY